MKVIFLGVGEAFDEKLPNNSLLVLSKTKILLDCGYSVPRVLWNYNNDQSFLDAIYISHMHADHYFGLPALIFRMIEEGRKKPLTIISHKTNIKDIKKVIDFGYRNVDRAIFNITYLGVEPGKGYDFKEFDFEFAPTEHSITNFAVKISKKDKIVCYSGDGNYTEESKKLYKNANLVVHEAYQIAKKMNGHATIIYLIEMCRELKINTLALTHIRRETRRDELDIIRQQINRCKNIFIPEPGDEHKI